MNREFQIGWRILGFAGAVLALSGCVQVSTRHTPDAVPKQGTAVIVSRLTKLGDALENKSVKYEIIDGFECGNLNSETANTDKHGIATITFRAADNAENCQTVLRITAEGSSRRHAIMVNPKGNLKIDGISAIAVILIASFAIDRIVTGFLFVLSFWPRWAAFAPEPVEAQSAVVTAHREKRQTVRRSGRRDFWFRAHADSDYRPLDY